MGIFGTNGPLSIHSPTWGRWWGSLCCRPWRHRFPYSCRSATAGSTFIAQRRGFAMTPSGRPYRLALVTLKPSYFLASGEGAASAAAGLLLSCNKLARAAATEPALRATVC